MHRAKVESLTNAPPAAHLDDEGGVVGRLGAALVIGSELRAATRLLLCLDGVLELQLEQHKLSSA